MAASTAATAAAGAKGGSSGGGGSWMDQLKAKAKAQKAAREAGGNAMVKRGGVGPHTHDESGQVQGGRDKMRGGIGKAGAAVGNAQATMIDQAASAEAAPGEVTPEEVAEQQEVAPTAPVTYKMPAAGKYKNSPINKNFGDAKARGFDSPLDLKSFGVGSLKGGVNAKGRSKTGPGGKFTGMPYAEAAMGAAKAVGGAMSKKDDDKSSEEPVGLDKENMPK